MQSEFFVQNPFPHSHPLERYHGSQAERQEIKNDLREYIPKKKGSIKVGKHQKKLDAVLTTFSYFSSEKSDDRHFLRKFDWNYVSCCAFSLYESCGSILIC